MTEQEIKRCLERFATCKVTDVMNFDYAGTLAYIERLKAANAELRHRAEVAERALEERATYCAMEDFDCFSLTTVAVEARAKELYNGWVQQSEKELTKEKNND